MIQTTNQNIVLYSYTLEQLETVLRDCIKAELKSLKPQDTPDDLITENEARSILKVSKVTLKKWRDRGQIKFYRIGTRIRYRKSELVKSIHGDKK